MPPFRLLRRTRRLRGVALAVATLLAVLLPGPAARAASAADAQAQVDRILVKVRAIQAEVATATADYDRVLGGVGQSVTRSITAQEALQRAEASARAQRQQLDDHVRGLYMSGGPLALYAEVLDASDLQDLASRVTLVRRVVDVDRTAADAGDLVVAAARRNADAASRAVHRQVLTERSVAQVADHLAALLAEQQALLDQASARASNLRAIEAARATLAAEQAAAGQITSERIASLQPLPAPPLYLTLYHRAAATCPGLSWTVLAAIGQVESGHGRDTSTSYAGAMGPMQFLPATFASYAVDGNHDGRLDIMDPADAIFTAANYLCANGAGQGGQSLYQAIWNYNHADWYVQMVLTLAHRYG